MTGNGRAWAAKCLAVNACGSAVDYAFLLLTAKVLGLPTALCAMIGVAAGATFNFVGNRRFAFADASAARWGGQALRYAVAMAVLMVVHSLCVSLLRDVVGVPLVPSKIAADASILAVSMPFVLRKFVFTAPAGQRVPGAGMAAAGAQAA